MKVLFASIFLFLAHFSISAQNINIPDSNFLNALIEANFDKNNDGIIQISETDYIGSLELINKEIQSLEGLQHFTSQFTFLDLSDNAFETFDFPNLNVKYLQINNNPLQGLNISNYSFLETLAIENLTIDTFKIFNSKVLKEIRINECTMSILRMDSLPQLNMITIGYSPNIKNIDFSTIPTLRHFYGYQNDALTSVNLENSNELKTFLSQYSNISSLNLSNCEKLNSLKCSFNNIEELDISTNEFLIELYADNNNLSSLVYSANNTLLEKIYVVNNDLSSLKLDSLPELRVLNIAYNELTELELLDLPKLAFIYTNDNFLNQLDLSNLKADAFFDASNNSLKRLLTKNGMDEEGYFLGNPDLQYICTDEQQLDYYAHKLTTFGYSCEINTYCSFKPGGKYHTVKGQSKINLDNAPCNFEDDHVPYMKINVESDSLKSLMISDSYGKYEISLLPEHYTLSPNHEVGEYFLFEPIIHEANFPEDGDSIVLNYCLSPNGEFNDLEVIFANLGSSIPGFTSSYDIIFTNKGSTIQTGEIHLIYEEQKISHISSSPQNNNQSSNSLSWNYENLKPFESRSIHVDFALNTPTDINPLNDGDTLKFDVTIDPVQDDETSKNNAYHLSDVVVNSVDPNDILLLEGEHLSQERIGDFVHYRIRFENNGTANAKNIVIKDSINLLDFDINSLQPILGSHNFETVIRNNNIVEFIFKGIDLSYEEGINKGHLIYKIKTLSSLSIGDSILNQAEIYFDYNFPIVTNLYSSLIVNPHKDTSVSQKHLELNVFPNPASSKISISSEVPISNISLYSLTGQLLLSRSSFNQEKEMDLNIENIPSGMHLVHIHSEAGTVVRKLVVE